MVGKHYVHWKDGRVIQCYGHIMHLLNHWILEAQLLRGAYGILLIRPLHSKKPEIIKLQKNHKNGIFNVLNTF